MRQCNEFVYYSHQIMSGNLEVRLEFLHPLKLWFNWSDWCPAYSRTWTGHQLSTPYIFIFIYENYHSVFRISITILNCVQLTIKYWLFHRQRQITLSKAMVECNLSCGFYWCLNKYFWSYSNLEEEAIAWWKYDSDKYYSLPPMTH